MGEPNKANGTGVVYRGELSGGVDAVLQSMSAGAHFGASIAVDERTLVMGAPGRLALGGSAVTNASATSGVFIRELDLEGEVLTSSRTLSVNNAVDYWVGYDVDVADGVVVVGAPHRTDEVNSRVFILKSF